MAKTGNQEGIKQSIGKGFIAELLAVNLQSVLSPFFPFIHPSMQRSLTVQQNSIAEKDVENLISKEGPLMDNGTIYAFLCGLLSTQGRFTHRGTAECKQLFGPFRQYLLHPTQGMPLPVRCDNTSSPKIGARFAIGFSE